MYWYLDFCDDHNPDNREMGYSNVPALFTLWLEGLVEEIGWKAGELTVGKLHCVPTVGTVVGTVGKLHSVGTVVGTLNSGKRRKR